jgi:hypothetical protein
VISFTRFLAKMIENKRDRDFEIVAYIFKAVINSYLYLPKQYELVLSLIISHNKPSHSTSSRIHFLHIKSHPKY